MTDSTIAVNSSEDQTQDQKRIPKCTGFGEPLLLHQWGTPGKFCEGQPKTTPTSTTGEDYDEQIKHLEQEYADLYLQAERHKKRSQVAELQAKIETQNQRGYGAIVTIRTRCQVPRT